MIKQENPQMKNRVSLSILLRYQQAKNIKILNKLKMTPHSFFFALH